MNLLAFMATDGGLVTARRDENVWHEVRRDLATYRMTSIADHGGHLLAGTHQGILSSDDLGQTWRPANAGLTIEHIRWLAFHPEYPSFAYAGTEPAAIFATRDGAQSWRECPEVANLRDANGWYLPYSPEAGCVRGFAFHGSRGYAAVEQGGALRSDDRGQTWGLAAGSTGDPRAAISESFIHPDVHSIAVHPSSPDRVYAPTGGGFYRSNDGGRTWSYLYKCYCRAVWADPADPDHLILGPADGVSRNGRIEETVDGGQTWRPASAGLGTPWPHHMVERFVGADERLLAVLSNGQLLATSLQVIDWQPILPEVEGVRAMVVLPG